MKTNKKQFFKLLRKAAVPRNIMLNKFLSLFKSRSAAEKNRADAVTVLSSPHARLSGKMRRQSFRLLSRAWEDAPAATPSKPFLVKFAQRLRGRSAAQLIKMHRRQSEEFNIGRRQKASKIVDILKGILPNPDPVLKMFAAQLTAIENEMLGRGMLLTINEA